MTIINKLIKIKSQFHGFLKTYNTPNQERIDALISITKVNTDIGILIEAKRNNRTIKLSKLNQIKKTDMIKILIDKKLLWISGEDIDHSFI